MMLTTPLSLPDVLVLEPTVRRDVRGDFQESFNQRDFEQVLGRPLHFVQDNQSRSRQNVLRGLHYQLGRPQAKLVRVAEGEIFDVVVDMRASSPSFGHWASVRLSAENGLQLWVPEGFAHGFLALSEHTTVLYKTSEYYAPDHERSLAWDDPQLAIAWPLRGAPILSEKDRNAPRFQDADTFD